jgi:PAS domain S-box-containing protein
MSTQYRVLLAEGDVNQGFSIIRELQRGGLDVASERVATRAGFQAALAGQTWDLLICDYDLPGLNGLEALALYRESGLDVPFIMVSGNRGEERAVEILKAGAHEYVLKESLARLVPAVNRELRAAQERRIRRDVETTMKHLASIVESCGDAVIGTTLDWTVLSWNAGAERLYGYTASEMIGRSVSVLIPAFHPEELRLTLESLSRGQGLNFETVQIRKDGSVVEVSLRISPIKDASGRILGASTVARDIAHLKQAEEDRLALIQDLAAALAAKTNQWAISQGDRAA